jgi:thioredoxin-dependent peroxiredoxin
MDPLPDVTATGTDGAPLRLRDLPRPLIVYFYPKDDTPGCTHEALDFSALASRFAAAGVGIVGISRDTVAKHNKFIARHGLAIPLASDLDGSVTEAFEVWGEKQMYGRTYMGIERATFLYDADGRLARAWRKVKVKGHAEEVLDAARSLG